MSVLSFDRTITYTGNGTTHTFAIGFAFMSTDDITVLINDAAMIPGTDYEFIGPVGSQSVHFIEYVLAVKTDKPPANGATIKFERHTPVLQPTAYRNQGQYFAKTHESSFDLITMAVQDLADSYALAASLIYDLVAYYAFTPYGSQVLGKLALTRRVLFSPSFPGSVAKAGTAATASFVVGVFLNGTQMGSITFGASSATGTFTGGDFTTVPGDVLHLAAQATPDATIKEIAITLAGRRLT